MMLKRRFERIMRAGRVRRGKGDDSQEQEPLHVEKGDMLAMVLAALITFVPIALLVLLLMVALPLLLTR